MDKKAPPTSLWRKGEVFACVECIQNIKDIKDLHPQDSLDSQGLRSLTQTSKTQCHFRTPSRNEMYFSPFRQVCVGSPGCVNFSSAAPPSIPPCGAVAGFYSGPLVALKLVGPLRGPLNLECQKQTQSGLLEGLLKQLGPFKIT